MMETGPINVVSLARELNIHTQLPQVPSIALGAAEISLYEMVKAYSAFANSGNTVKPFGILRIEDSEGNVIYENRGLQQYEPAFSAVISAQINYMLRGVVNEGTGRTLRSIYGVDSDLAGKTGTTQNNADGWFIGYTPNFVAGVWVGAELPVIHFRTIALGSGAHQALPIFGRTVNQMENDYQLSVKYLQPFPALSDSLLLLMDCPDFTLEDPEQNIFDKFKDLFAKDKDQKETRKEKRETKKEIQKTDEQKEGFFKRLRKKFKRKKTK
jgi:penicillin-binding protein 1A